MVNATSGQPSDVFNLFLDFYDSFTMYNIDLANLNALNRILKKLFKMIDTTHVIIRSKEVDNH
jgi:hypothetical protein